MSNTRTLEPDISKEGTGTCVKVGQGDDGGTTIKALILARKVDVLDIAKATCDVFDALAAEQPAAMAMSASNEGQSKTFAEALADLKALVYGTEE